MKTTYGTRETSRQAGMLRAFRIDNLVRLDEETGDGRMLRSEGAGVRALPRTVFGGFDEGDPHGANVVIGRLDAVEFDPENHTATGWGWLLDDDNGRLAARYIDAGAMSGNSIHMTEIEVTVEWDEDDWMAPPKIIFEKWSVASTTMLGIPAFKDSKFVLDEVTAALFTSEEPLVVDGAFTATFDMEMPHREEITADGSPKPAWEHFYRAEGNEPEAITIGEMDGDGWYPVWGNLARWNVCHDGIDARCVIAPYDPTEYASFNASSVLTSRGRVPTGPIFFKGGHPDQPLGEGDVAKAYGGIENAWADVRVTHGVHGPWISGVVRPNVTNDSVYCARASRISGHWSGDGRLKAIVSVNVPGYDVHTPAESKVYTDDQGKVLEVVASFVPDCETKGETNAELRRLLSEPSVLEQLADINQGVAPSMDWNTNRMTLTIDPVLLFDPVTAEARAQMAARFAEIRPVADAPSDVDVTDEAEVARHLALLDLEDDADLV